MPTASLHRLRERRVEALLSEGHASMEGRSDSSSARSPFLLTLAPALAVFCGVSVFFALSQREKVWPQAAIQHYQPAVQAAPPVAVPVRPKIETVTVRLRRSRRFSEAAEGLQLRLTRTDMRRQFCDVDVRTGRTGFRRVRLRAGQQVQLNGSAYSLHADTITRGPLNLTASKLSN